MAKAKEISSVPSRRSKISKIKKTLVGVWTPDRGQISNVPAWPRLVFLPDHHCLFEQGDYPAIYATDHFVWNIPQPTVLEIRQHRVELLSDDCRSTAWADEEPKIEDQIYDMALHHWREHIILETVFLKLQSQGSWIKTPELVDTSYQSSWRFY